VIQESDYYAMSQETKSQTRAKQIFSKASPEHQSLIRDMLREEREVINMKRRSDIHTRLYEHIRRIIK
jgi:hypothetical protein